MIKLAEGQLGSLLKKNADTIIDFLLLLVFAFVPFWRMGIAGIWNIHDQDFPVYPIDKFYNSLFLWDHHLTGYTGFLDVISIQRVWFFALWWILSKFGLSASVIQRFSLIVPMALSGYGTYLLVNALFKWENRTLSRVAGIVSGTFYMLNPYVAYRIFLGAYPWIDLVALPYTFLFLFKGLQFSHRTRDGIKYASLTALTSVPLLTYHFETTVAIIILLSAYALYSLFEHLSLTIFKRRLGFLLLTILFAISLNSWWLLPAIYVATTSAYVAQAYMATYVLERINWMSKYPLLLIQNIRLNPFVHNSIYQSYWNWYWWVTSPIFDTIAIILFIVSTLAMLLRPRDKHVLFFFIINVIFIGFANGLNPPFGLIFKFLFDTISIFRVFSEIFKFLHTVTLSYAILLGVAAAELLKRFTNTFPYGRKSSLKDFSKPRSHLFPKLVSSFIIVLVLLNVFPLLSGNFQGVLEPARVPEYFFEARTWLEGQNGDFRIFSMPQEPNYKVAYTWGPNYTMVPFERNMLGRPVLVQAFTTSDPPSQFMSKVYDSLQSSFVQYVGKMLNLLDVKYVMVVDNRTRTVPNLNMSQLLDTATIKSALSHHKDLQLVRTFGALHFFENTVYKPSLIYGTTIYLLENESSYGYSLPEIYWSLPEEQYPSCVAILALKNVSDYPYIIDKTTNVTNIVSIKWTNISSADKLDGWTASHVSKIQIDTNDFVEGKGAIMAVSNATGPFPPSELDYLLPSSANRNWSGEDFISLWFKSNSNGGKFAFMVQDKQRNYAYWFFNYSTPNVWDRIILRIGSPNVYSYPPPSLEDINGFSIQVFAKSSSLNVTYRVDSIQIGQFKPTGKILETCVPLKYRMIDPTYYQVNVQGKKPFILVFSESFNPYWKAYIQGEGKELTHFLVNFYANGWYVGKGGNYTITIKFEPQNLVHFEFSLLSLSSIIVYNSLLKFNKLEQLYEWVRSFKRMKKYGYK